MAGTATRGRPWHAMAVPDVLDALVPSPPTASGPGPPVRAGLSAAEARRRLAEVGRNEIPLAPPPAWWWVLLRQFVSPLIAVLLVAAVVTLVQRHWVDAGAILLTLAVNAALGFWQERRAEREVRALRSLAAPTATAVRDGAVQALPAAELVPGDVVLLEGGVRVPADLRLVETNALRVDESMLTGEALPVTKAAEAVDVAAVLAERRSLAFSGTLVTAGRGRGLVVATGAATELGAISAMVQEQGSRTPLQELTRALERRIGLVVALASAGVMVIGLALGHDASEMFRTAVALAVASVPESLPIVLTVAMSLGVTRMARRRAIVRSLPAVETLGSTTVIGSDKTGTLTQNRMTVEALWTASGHVEVPPDAGPGLAEDRLVRAVLRTGALTNEATPTRDGDVAGDAVDVAMASVALRTGAVTQGERERAPAAHTPYEPELRYSQSVRRAPDGRWVLHVKGAPDTLLAMSTHLEHPEGPVPVDEEAVDRAHDAMARRGLRVIATAARVLPGPPVEPLPPPDGLTFLGLEGMTDPPRPGVLEAVARCRQAGIAVKMITGDHPVTATSVARRLGLPTEAPPLTGPEMAALDDEGLARRLEETHVAARVAPQDKLRIVQVLQGRDEVVAVTGDGVNDAPALKAASIGVAMGRSGTDVAREAADLVLTDDDFVTIVAAVEQGRVTFAAIRKATFFLLAAGAASLLAVAVNVLAGRPLLFLPVQLLWMNIVTNGLQDIALAFEPAEGDELRRSPRPRSEGVLSRALWWRTALVGVWIALVVLLASWTTLDAGRSAVEARSVAVATFVMANFFLVLSARSEQRSVLTLSPWGNPFLLVASVAAVLLHVTVSAWPVTAGLLGVVPLDVGRWGTAALVGSTVLLLVEADKALRRRQAGPSRAGRVAA